MARLSRWGYPPLSAVIQQASDTARRAGATCWGERQRTTQAAKLDVLDFNLIVYGKDIPPQVYRQHLPLVTRFVDLTTSHIQMQLQLDR